MVHYSLIAEAFRADGTTPFASPESHKAYALHYADLDPKYGSHFVNGDERLPASAPVVAIYLARETRQTEILRLAAPAPPADGDRRDEREKTRTLHGPSRDGFSLSVKFGYLKRRPYAKTAGWDAQELRFTYKKGQTGGLMSRVLELLNKHDAARMEAVSKISRGSTKRQRMQDFDESVKRMRQEFTELQSQIENLQKSIEAKEAELLAIQAEPDHGDEVVPEQCPELDAILAE